MASPKQPISLQDLARANRLIALKRAGHVGAVFAPVDRVFETLMQSQPEPPRLQKLGGLIAHKTTASSGPGLR